MDAHHGPRPRRRRRQEGLPALGRMDLGRGPMCGRQRGRRLDRDLPIHGGGGAGGGDRLWRAVEDHRSEAGEGAAVSCRSPLQPRSPPTAGKLQMQSDLDALAGKLDLNLRNECCLSGLVYCQLRRFRLLRLRRWRQQPRRWTCGSRAAASQQGHTRSTGSSSVGQDEIQLQANVCGQKPAAAGEQHAGCWSCTGGPARGAEPSWSLEVLPAERPSRAHRRRWSRSEAAAIDLGAGSGPRGAHAEAAGQAVNVPGGSRGWWCRGRRDRSREEQINREKK